MKILDNPAMGAWVIVIACGIIFAETGLLVGFFLPGDSLLFTAGLLVSTGAMPVNIWVLMAMLIVSGFIGNQLGYFIGYKAGPAIFNKPESKLFKKQHVDSAHAFFEKHGGKALILARFVPIVRTFVPVIVGVAKMDMRKFVLFNAIGAVLGPAASRTWAISWAIRCRGCATTSTSSSSPSWPSPLFLLASNSSRP